MKSLPLLLAALFLGGVQSTLFGPVKYAILPQHLRESELVGGNALVETGTSVAILAGMILGGWMIAQAEWGIAGVAVRTCGLSAAGIVLSRFIPKSPAADPTLAINWNPLHGDLAHSAICRPQPDGFSLDPRHLVVLVLRRTAGHPVSEPGRATCCTATSRSSRCCSSCSRSASARARFCARRLSGHKVELGLVPFGSIGLTLFGIDLWASPASPSDGRRPIPLRTGACWPTSCSSASLAASTSCRFTRWCRAAANRTHRSRIIAANNVLNALFIVAAAGVSIALLAAGLSIPQLILVGALMNAAVAIYIYTLVPEFLMRFVVWLLIHSVYRLRKSRHRAHTRRGRRGRRLQPRLVRRRAGHLGRMPAPDPLGHAPRDLQDPGAQLRVPHRQGDSHCSCTRGRRDARAGVRSDCTRAGRRPSSSASFRKADSLRTAR